MTQPAYLRHPQRAPRRTPRTQKVRVSDHALVRWLTRVHGVDMEQFREEIIAACGEAAQAGATRLRTEECDFVMLNGTVITVLADVLPA